MLTTNSNTRSAGFTLIELLIVIAIIGALVAIVVPTYQSSVRKANEASAVATLNAVRIGQAKYVADHKGQYGSLKQLFEEGYLDKRFNYDTPHSRGYHQGDLPTLRLLAVDQGPCAQKFQVRATRFPLRLRLQSRVSGGETAPVLHSFSLLR